MKKDSFWAVILISIILPCFAFASENIKLPYAAREQFVVTTGYDTPPTHIKKDSYAIDFTQDGCSAYGKPAVAAFSGTAWIVEESGYNGGYGTQLLILAHGNVIARYAHLVQGSIPVTLGDTVPQGTIIGEIGDTGLVVGTACAEHPGTHIHFAMDMENADGSFMAKPPEPISGYTGITAGKWYVSDNVLAATKGNLATLVEILNSLLGSSVAIVSPLNPMATAMPASSSAQPPPTSGSQQTQPTISAEPLSSVDVSASAPAVPLPSSSAVSSSPMPQSQSAANSNSTSTTKTTSSIVSMPADGGFGPIGGVSVSIPSVSIMTLAVAVSSSTTSSPDNPSDDTVKACE